MDEAIGIIGLGLVGGALSRSLLSRGYGVTGFDIDGAKGGMLEKAGGRAADSPAGVAESSRTVFLCLMTTAVVEEVIEGEKGLLSSPVPPGVIIDTTTGDPDRTVLLAERLRKRGVAFLDAPVSGSSRLIRERQGLFMVGGDAAAFERCQALFSALSEKKAIHMGPSGSGSRAKLASNLILGLNRAALAEGLAFSESLGLDLDSFLKVLRMSPAYSIAMDDKGEKMIRGDFSPEARLKQHHKDVSIILEYAHKRGLELPLSRAHLDLMEASIRAGDGDLDNSAVIREIRRRKRT